ncbi:MAG: stage II sporulation protein M [Leptospiraceae bacterium]|nr:stage II sporulation protein M [Leptospiraceae bacterium]
MTPIEFINKRNGDWQRLESLLDQLENRMDFFSQAGQWIEFARLYRAVSTDLSLSDVYRLSTGSREYLQDLVGRSHSVLYSFSRSRLRNLATYLSHFIPRRVFADVYVWICQIAFFGTFFISGYISWQTPDFAVSVVGESMIEQIQEMHLDRNDHSPADKIAASAWYVFNNGSIDLQTFILGILGGIGSLVSVLFNGIFIGAIIGYLLSGPAAANITCWITGHAVFELYAIGLSAGAGLRIGYAFIAANGRSRLLALQEEARNAVPIIGIAVTLTILAGFIEAWLGPMPCGSGWSRIWLVKLAVMSLSLFFVISYFYILGFLRYRAESLRPK